MRFNYKDCSFEDLVQHLMEAPARTTAGILSHYKASGNEVMYQKIFDARCVANKLKKSLRRAPKNFDCHSLVYYDESSPTGLRWKVDRYYGPNDSIKLASSGDVAGGRNGGRHQTYRFMYHYETYLVHRIIWELFYGKLKDSDILDHIDGCATNNKIDNLRIVSAAVNSKNCKKRVDNTSGVCGVYLESTTKKGSPYEYWVAHYMKSVGEKAKKYFSIKKYGNDEAFKLACEYRNKMLEQLNQQGAGYTERHGKETK